MRPNAIFQGFHKKKIGVGIVEVPQEILCEFPGFARPSLRAIAFANLGSTQAIEMRKNVVCERGITPLAHHIFSSWWGQTGQMRLP